MARPINNDYVPMVNKSALGIISQSFSKCDYTQFGFRLAANPSLKIAGLITALSTAYDWLCSARNSTVMPYYLKSIIISFAIWMSLSTGVISQTTNYKYDIIWTGNEGSTATGAVVFNTLNPSCSFTLCPNVESFNISVEGQNFTKSDFTFRVNVGTLDPQNTSNLANTLPDFNIRAITRTASSPYGVWYNVFTTTTGAMVLNDSNVRYSITSFSLASSDTTPPTLAITAAEVSDGATSNDATLALTFTASEATSNFVVGDITVSNGTLSSFAAASSTVYTATFTPTAAGATTVDVAGGAFTDGAGNANTAATQFNWTFDSTAPTLAITAAEVSDGATSNDATLALTFTASEATSNFVVGDITVSNGTLSSFAAASSTVYTATFTPTAAGATTVDVAGGAFTDGAGNANTAATQFNWIFDSTAPTLAITAAEVNDGATSNDATLALTFTASEATSNFVVGDITVSNGTLSSFAAASSTVYTATFTPTAAGATTVDVAGGAFTDGAGNANTAATQFNWTFDSTAPTLAITAAEVSDGATSNDATLALTFTASEATSNFVVGDITVSNGTLSSFAAASSTVYTATFTPAADGATTIDVAGGAFTDGAGNANTAATQFNWTFDSTAPTLAITAAEVNDGATSNDATLALTFTASEATSNFVVGDITVSNGTLSSFAAASSTVYTATFTPAAVGRQQLMLQGAPLRMAQAMPTQLPHSSIGPSTRPTQHLRLPQLR